MDKDKDPDEEQSFEELQSNLKQVCFCVQNRLIKQAEATSDYLWYALTFIETLQILWFSIHPTFNFLSSSLGIAQFHLGIRYLGFEYAMRSSQSLWQVLIVASFVVVALHAATIMVTAYMATRSKPSQATDVLAKIANIQILVFNTILVGPLINVVTVTLYCDPNSPYHLNQVCYAPSSIGYYVLAVLVGVWTILECLVYNLTYYTKNPLSKCCVAMPGDYGGVAKILLKVMPPLYFLIDINSQYQSVYIFALVVVLFGYIFFFRIFSRHHFSERFYYFAYSCEIVVSWFSLTNIIQYYLSVPGTINLCFYYTLLGSAPLCYVFVRLEQNSKNKIFLEGIRNVKKNKQLAEQFLQMIINIVDMADTPASRIQLLGFMKIHSTSCEKDSGCICHSFLEDFFRRKQLSREEEQLQFNKFLKCLMQDYIKKYPSVVLFRLMFAYLLYYRLDSKVQAVHCVAEAGREKLSFAEQLMVRRLKLQFEQDSREKENDQSMDKGHAIRVYLEFNQRYLNFESQVQSCAKDVLEYWCELAEDSPSVLKLWNLARLCQLKAAKVEQFFNEICEVYPNNLKTLGLYSIFLRDIALNRKEFSKLEDRIHSEKSNSESASNRQTGSDMKFRENSNLCIITIQTAIANMGTIVNCNSELQGILQFSKTEVVGQKITKLMPKLYYELHDGFISKYIGRPDAEITSREFPMFPLNKKGFMVQAALLVKLIPELEDGFHLAGFIRKADEAAAQTNHYIMYNEQTLVVEEFSESCLSLGFSAEAIAKTSNSSPINLKYLFPEFKLEDVAVADLKNDGHQTFMDLRIVSEAYIENEGDLEQISHSHQQRVKLFLMAQGKYDKVNIKVLKFSLLQEGGGGGLQVSPTIQFADQADEYGSAQKQITRESQRRQSYDQGERTQEHDASGIEKVDGEQAFQKKFKEFVSHQRSRILIALLVAGVYIFLVLEMALVSVDISQNIGNSNEVLAAMSSINDTQAVPMLLGGVAFNARKLQMTYNLSLKLADYAQYQSDLVTSVAQLQSITVNQIRQEVVLNSSYGYNAPKLFDTFTFYNSGGSLSQDFEYSDAIFELTTIALSTGLQNYSVFNLASINGSVQKDLSFIKANDLTVYPKLANYKLTNLTSYFDGRFASYTSTRLILLGLRILSLLIIFLVILPVIVKLDKTNNKLLGLYRLIPISDVIEVQRKCEGFLASHFEEIQARNKVKENIERQINAQVTAVLLKIEELQEDTERAVQQEASLQKKVPKVKLGQIPNSKAQIIFLCCFTIFLLGYCVGEYYLHFSFFMPFRQYQQQLSLLGKVRNSNRFVTVYSQEYMAQQTYRKQLVNTMISIYSDSELLFSQVPDDNKVREIIYGKMEQIKNLMKAPSQQLMKSPIYKKIESDLGNVQLQLNGYIDTFLGSWQFSINDGFRKVASIKFAVEFVLVLLLIKILLSGYFAKLKIKTKRSISMVMMIPSNIASKNQNILTQL